MDNELVCESCGCEESWNYIGEAYDDGEHLGSMYECQECGHHQCDDIPDPDANFEEYWDF